MTQQYPHAQQQYPPQPYPAPRNGFGITSLCLAIPGLLFGLIPLTGFIAIILGALGLVFGLLGWGRVRRGAATNKGMSITATVLSTGALILGVVGVVIVASAVEELDEDLQEIEQDLQEDLDELEGNQ